MAPGLGACWGAPERPPQPCWGSSGCSGSQQGGRARDRTQVSRLIPLPAPALPQGDTAPCPGPLPCPLPSLLAIQKYLGRPQHEVPLMQGDVPEGIAHLRLSQSHFPPDFSVFFIQFCISFSIISGISLSGMLMGVDWVLHPPAAPPPGMAAGPPLDPQPRLGWFLRTQKHLQLGAAVPWRGGEALGLSLCRLN